MTFATEKEKAASERYMFVRLEPARDLASSFSSLGGGLYSASMPFKPSRVQRNGAALVKDNTTPTINDHYYWNGADLICKFAATPASDVVAAFYYLHFTGSIWREAYSTPGDGATDLVSWEPRIVEYPGFTQSVEDLLSGVFSISGLDLQLANSDKNFNKYFSNDDSFYQKYCDIWLGISDETVKIYSGVVASCSVSDVCSLSILDRLNVTSNVAFMGDSEDEVFINKSTYPNAISADVGKVIPFILGRYSKREVDMELGGSSTSFFKPMDVNSHNRAYCTNYNSTISTVNNREWKLARCRSIKKQSFGAIVRALVLGASPAAAHFYFSSYSNLYIGQPVRWNEGGTDYYGVISIVGDYILSGNTYNIRVSCYSAAASTSSIFTANYCLSVFVRTIDSDNNPSLPNYQFSETLLEGLNYTVNETTTSGGNKSISITFSSGMESFVSTNHVQFKNTFIAKFTNRALDPLLDSVHYSLFPGGSLNHADVISDILGDMGLTVNSASISAAASDLPKNVLMTIGAPDDVSLPTYADVLSKILASTLGFLSPISDGEIGYYLFKKPNPATTPGDDFIDGSVFTSLGVDIQYQDIYSAITARNEIISIQYIGAEFGGGIGGNIIADKEKTIENKRAEFLHGVKRIKYIDYALDDFSDTLDDILSIISNRKASYRFATATKNLNHYIGKDLYIVSDKCLGISGNSKIKLLANNIEGKSAKLICYDLLGLERT